MVNERLRFRRDKHRYVMSARVVQAGMLPGCFAEPTHIEPVVRAGSSEPTHNGAVVRVGGSESTHIEAVVRAGRPKPTHIEAVVRAESSGVGHKELIVRRGATKAQRTIGLLCPLEAPQATHIGPVVPPGSAARQNGPPPPAPQPRPRQLRGSRPLRPPGPPRRWGRRGPH